MHRVCCSMAKEKNKKKKNWHNIETLPFPALIFAAVCCCSQQKRVCFDQVASHPSGEPMSLPAPWSIKDTRVFDGPHTFPSQTHTGWKPTLVCCLWRKPLLLDRAGENGREFLFCLFFIFSCPSSSRAVASSFTAFQLERHWTKPPSQKCFPACVCVIISSFAAHIDLLF